MSSTRVLRYAFVLSLLCATSACVVEPFPGGAGEHGGENNDHGSREHHDNLRNIGRPTDAGDRTEHEQSGLSSGTQQLAGVQFFFWSTVYYPEHGTAVNGQISGIWT